MKVCSKCGKTEKDASIWYFCKRCQLFLCYWCYKICPHCKSDKEVVRV